MREKIRIEILNKIDGIYLGATGHYLEENKIIEIEKAILSLIKSEVLDKLPIGKKKVLLWKDAKNFYNMKADEVIEFKKELEKEIRWIIYFGQ